MKQADTYVDELLALNEHYLGRDSAGLREQAVYCFDRQGRRINFSAPDDIAALLARLASGFASDFREATDLSALGRAFAKFYYGLIAIHPFNDANRRTAFAFLEHRAAERNFTLTTPDLLRNVLFEGSVAIEIQKLWLVFDHILKPLPRSEGVLS